MSYEGYRQALCQEGHYYTYDVYNPYVDCPYCHSPTAWENSVDQTNGEEWGVIPLDLLKGYIIEEAAVETCPTCGVSKTKTATRYRIPTEEERRAMRHAYHWNDTMHERGLIPCSVLEQDWSDG